MVELGFELGVLLRALNFGLPLGGMLMCASITVIDGK
jgi:hypothetical protein